MEQLPKIVLSRLEAGLERLGPVLATIVICTVAVLISIVVNAILKEIEGSSITTAALINIPIQVSVVAIPLILYSRRVIRQLARSRAELQSMSVRLVAAAEAAQDSSRAKSAFLANMSHELRTPLNAILGFSEIMKDQHLGPVSNPRYLSYAADIHSSGRHLLGIINDVLDLAKIESGKMTLDGAEEFALVQALVSPLAMLSALGQKHGVTLTCEWDNADIRLVAVDRMVRQIILNLGSNAIKFTPAGGTVKLSGALAPDGAYVLTVRDSGIGMSEPEIATALTPFGQNRATMATQQGTGLGLPLAKAMVELHGGSLTVASKPQCGTCITLRFPPERVARQGAQAAA